MNLDNYKRITGKTPKASSFNIYLEHEATPDEVNKLYAEIRLWSHDYGDVKISNKDITLLNTVARDKHYNELYVVISLLILVISPLVWFFSQALYYGKREKEFNILQSIGAVAKEPVHVAVPPDCPLSATIEKKHSVPGRSPAAEISPEPMKSERAVEPTERSSAAYPQAAVSETVLAPVPAEVTSIGRTTEQGATVASSGWTARTGASPTSEKSV